MKRLVASLVVLLCFFLVADAIAADTYVRGYTNRNNTYVEPHYRTAPNNTPYDNYSTRGNVNPYTGQVGTRDPDRTPSYGSAPSTIYGNQAPRRRTIYGDD